MTGAFATDSQIVPMRAESSLVSARDVLKMDYQKFLDSLDDGSVDMVLTDPPYAISRTSGFVNVKNGVQRFAVSMDFGDWDHKEIDLKALAEGMFRVLRKGGTAIVWYDVWKTSYLADAMAVAKFKMIRLVIWNKLNPVPLNSKATYLSGCREVAVVGVKGGTPVFKSSYDDGVYDYPIPRHNGNRVHPTQKPLELFSRLIEKHSNRHDLVIDPFLGSGTTAVAAMNLDRRFKGCDINSRYVRAAKRRIKKNE